MVTDATDSSRVPVDCCQVPVAAYALAVDATAMPESSAVTEPARLRIPFSRLPRYSVRGGLTWFEEWSFYRTISGVRLCWELEETKGPKGPAAWVNRLVGSVHRFKVRLVILECEWSASQARVDRECVEMHGVDCRGLRNGNVATVQMCGKRLVTNIQPQTEHSLYKGATAT